MDDPELEDALDGLVAASKYCEEQGHYEISRVIGHLYQRLGDIEMGESQTEYDDLEKRITEIVGEVRRNEPIRRSRESFERVVDDDSDT